MKRVLEQDGLELFEYIPTRIKPFYIDMEPITIMRRFRFLIDFHYGYKVYYLKKDGEYVGYCTITNGKNPRFWFASEKDILVGPYFVEESYRGKGYSTKMVDWVIHKCGLSWKNAFLYILNTNIPSIRVVEKLGGTKIFNVHNTFYRKLVKKDSGEYGIHLIKGENNENS